MEINVASEHKCGNYDIDGHKGKYFYTYMCIDSEKLGVFFVSYIKVNENISDIRLDGYPWEFLMNESEYKLTQEQIDFVERNKALLLKKDFESIIKKAT